jgi:phosphate uptake regulator
MIIHILEDSEIQTREAVVYALFCRYLKRIAAHLANIFTTISNPFHLVGYGVEDSSEEIE